MEDVGGQSVDAGSLLAEGGVRRVRLVGDDPHQIEVGGVACGSGGSRAMQDQADGGRIGLHLPRQLVQHAHRGSDSSYGGRWMPSSVTIAVISAAGVTSKAGFRAAKRAVISAPSRSSIGISAPVGVAGSTVDVGATT